MKDCVTIMGISSIAYILSNIYCLEPPNVWVLAHAQWNKILANLARDVNTR